MKLKGIQKDADGWVSKHKAGYWPPANQLLGLTEELGEVAREVNHLYGSKKKRKGERKGSLGGEIVDTIFSLVCLANSQNINLSKEWKKMFKKKLNGRDKDRFEKK